MKTRAPPASPRQSITFHCLDILEASVWVHLLVERECEVLNLTVVLVLTVGLGVSGRILGSLESFWVAAIAPKFERIALCTVMKKGLDQKKLPPLLFGFSNNLIPSAFPPPGSVA